MPISFIMWQFGLAILNYLDDLAGAEKKKKATCLMDFNEILCMQYCD